MGQSCGKKKKLPDQKKPKLQSGNFFIVQETEPAEDKQPSMVAYEPQDDLFSQDPNQDPSHKSGYLVAEHEYGIAPTEPRRSFGRSSLIAEEPENFDEQSTKSGHDSRISSQTSSSEESFQELKPAGNFDTRSLDSKQQSVLSDYSSLRSCEDRTSVKKHRKRSLRSKENSQISQEFQKHLSAEKPAASSSNSKRFNTIDDTEIELGTMTFTSKQGSLKNACLCKFVMTTPDQPEEGIVQPKSCSELSQKMSSGVIKPEDWKRVSKSTCSVLSSKGSTKSVQTSQKATPGSSELSCECRSELKMFQTLGTEEEKSIESSNEQILKEELEVCAERPEEVMPKEPPRSSKHWIPGPIPTLTTTPQKPKKPCACRKPTDVCKCHQTSRISAPYKEVSRDIELQSELSEIPEEPSEEEMEAEFDITSNKCSPSKSSAETSKSTLYQNSNETVGTKTSNRKILEQSNQTYTVTLQPKYSNKLVQVPSRHPCNCQPKTLENPSSKIVALLEAKYNKKFNTVEELILKPPREVILFMTGGEFPAPRTIKAAVYGINYMDFLSSMTSGV